MYAIFTRLKGQALKSMQTKLLQILKKKEKDTKGKCGRSLVEQFFFLATRQQTSLTIPTNLTLSENVSLMSMRGFLFIFFKFILKWHRFEFFVQKIARKLSAEYIKFKFKRYSMELVRNVYSEDAINLSRQTIESRRCISLVYYTWEICCNR